MTGDNGRSGRGRPRRFAVETAWALLVLAVAGALCFVRYEDPRRIAISGDSYWYLRQAQMFAGVAEPVASATAADLVCADMNRSAVDRSVDDPDIRLPACEVYDQSGISPRYIAIFGSRPGYPLVAAPFVAAYGPWTGMVAATVLLALGAALLAYLAVWLATGLRLAGVLAAGLLFVFPSGFWLTRMLAEGAMVVGYLAALIGAMLLWRRRWAGLPLLVVALGWLFTVRSASGAAAAISLLAASVLALLTRVPDRRGPLVTGGLAAVTLAGWFTASAVYGLPGLNETIQDFATRHFRLPDIADPLDWLWRKNLEYWPIEGRRLLIAPWSILAGVAAAAILIRRARHVALLWIILGVTGLMLMVAHPADGEYDRMMIPLWLPVSAAFGYAVALGLRGPRPGAARRTARPATTAGAPLVDAPAGVAESPDRAAGATTVPAARTGTGGPDPATGGADAREPAAATSPATPTAEAAGPDGAAAPEKSPDAPGERPRPRRSGQAPELRKRTGKTGSRKRIR